MQLLDKMNNIICIVVENYTRRNYCFVSLIKCRVLWDYTLLYNILIIEKNPKVNNQKEFKLWSRDDFISSKSFETYLN